MQYHLETECKKTELSSYKIDGSSSKKYDQSVNRYLKYSPTELLTVGKGASEAGAE